MPRYDFKHKGSNDTLFSVNAVSMAQAIRKGVKAHPSMEWLNSDIERGLITITPEAPLQLPPEANREDPGPVCPNCGSTNVVPGRVKGELQCRDDGWSWEPDVEEAINQLLKTIPDNTDAKPMIKQWKKKLNSMMPVSKDVNEDT